MILFNSFKIIISNYLNLLLLHFDVHTSWWPGSQFDATKIIFLGLFNFCQKSVGRIEKVSYCFFLNLIATIKIQKSFPGVLTAFMCEVSLKTVHLYINYFAVSWKYFILLCIILSCITKKSVCFDM